MDNVISDCSARAGIKALMRIADKAARDPARPAYHYHPQAAWMNDTNGCYYKDGWYHIFHLQDPFSAKGCSTAMLPDGSIVDGEAHPNRFWAHSRSRDLINWEYMEPALYPDRESGEINPISGDSVIRKDGSVMLIFTAKQIGTREDIQRAAVSWDEKHWERIPGKLLQISDVAHRIAGSWRDPFVWKQDGRFYMLIGAETETEAQLLIFQACDDNLFSWQYKGIFLEKQKTEVEFFECPRLFEVGKKWVLLFSPYKPVEYYVGTIDWTALRFHITDAGKVDCGTQAYASVVVKGMHPPVMFSWIAGWNPKVYSESWNGCLSVPRCLSIDSGGRLIQEPHPILKTLRKDEIRMTQAEINEGGQLLLLEQIPDRMELELELEWDETFEGELLFESPDKKECRHLLLGEKIEFEDLETEAAQHGCRIHGFLDGSIWELFLPNERSCMTRKLFAGTEVWNVILKAEKETVRILYGNAYIMGAAEFTGVGME